MLIVAVTGHAVVVVYVTTVTVDSGGAEKLPGAEGLELAGEELEKPAGGVAWEAKEVAGKLPLGLGPADVDLVGDEPAGGDLVDVDAAGVETAGGASVTGHTVVEIAMVEVTTEVESAGQSVMAGAQLVIVTSLVVYTVEVVHLSGTLAVVVMVPAADEVPAGEVLTGGEDTGAKEELKGVEDVLKLVGWTEADELQAPVPRGCERGLILAMEDVSGTEGTVKVVPGVQSKPML